VCAHKISDAAYIASLERIFGSGHLSQDPELHPLMDGVAFRGAALDFGCGLGGMGTKLLDAGFDRVIGLDPSPDLVRIANQRASERGASDELHAQVLAGASLPLPDGAVDVALVKDVPFYVADLGPILRELRRCLVDGGVLVAAVQHVRARPWSSVYDRFLEFEGGFMPVFPRELDEITSAVEACGFDLHRRDSTSRTFAITQRELARLRAMDGLGPLRDERVSNWVAMEAAYESGDLMSSYLHARAVR